MSIVYWLLYIACCLLDIEAHLEFIFGHTLVAAVHRNSLRVVVKIPKISFSIEPKSHHPLEVPLVPVYTLALLSLLRLGLGSCLLPLLLVLERDRALRARMVEGVYYIQHILPSLFAT